MIDIVAVLQKHTGTTDLTALVRDLEDAPTTQRNAFFRTFVERIRKAAGVAPRPPAERGAILEFLDANHH